MLLGTSGASLLGNLLTEKGIVRAGTETEKMLVVKMKSCGCLILLSENFLLS